MPTREELQDLLRTLGAEVRDTMSKKVDCLLVGEGYGRNKITYAREKGIITISLPMFDYLGLFNGSPPLPASSEYIKDLLPDLTLNTAFLCEVLYAHSLGTGPSGARTESERRTLGCFYMLAAGLERLLQDISKGYPTGDTRGTLEELAATLPGIDE